MPACPHARFTGNVSLASRCEFLANDRYCRLVTSLKPVEGRAQALRLFARYVSGNGIELGPGHVPFPLPYPGTAARYVDRWKPDENRQLFPELEDDAGFPVPDIVADLNVERLSMLDDQSQDFVIASHVLEHLADPLGHLCEIHRVLRPGGIALVLLPDRGLTFDQFRQPTPLQHLIDEHADDARTIDDAHLEEFLRGSGDWDDAWDAAEQAAQLERHRQRSIHVHCWTQEEFLPVLVYAVADLGLSFELLDALFHEDFPGSIEFGFVLRRSVGKIDPVELGERLDEVWRELVHEHWSVRDQRAHAANTQAELDRIVGHPAFRAALRAKRYARGAAALVKRLRAR